MISNVKYELILAPFLLFLLHRVGTAWHTVWFIQRKRCNEARRGRGISYYFVTSNKGGIVVVSLCFICSFIYIQAETTEGKLNDNIFDIDDFEKPKNMIS